MKEDLKETSQQKPPCVLSTSLGIILAANLLLTPTLTVTKVYGETAAEESKLVEWSSEQVKKFYNASMDWNIPLPVDSKLEKVGAPGSTVSPSPTPIPNGSSNTPVIVNQGGGFGMTDLLLYHMIFNRGGSYSANQMYNSRPVFNPGTTRPYQAKTFGADTFQNRPTTGSTVRPPTTSQTSGTFSTKSSMTTKSTSSSSSGIGGKSGGFSSSSSSSSSSSGG